MSWILLTADVTEELALGQKSVPMQVRKQSSFWIPR